MDEIEELISKAVEAAKQATHFDSSGNIQAAAYLYYHAASLLEDGVQLGYTAPKVTEKIAQYRQRSRALEAIAQKTNKEVVLKGGQTELNRAKFLLLEGFDEDEQGNAEEAVKLYSSAVSLCLEACNKLDDEGMKMKLRHLADEALSRAEVLKGMPNVSPSKSAATTQAKLSSLTIPPLGIGNLVTVKNVSDHPYSTNAASAKLHGLQVSGATSYSREELEVLLKTSSINRREYVPFMGYDIKEKFAFSLPFSDKNGYLALAPKQQKSFQRWARPDELSSAPKMIELVDCFSIKQTCVSDCSFVASLAVSALYEKKYKKRLITDIIYPKNHSGDPVYNPCGKYMIKLHINGIARKVIIDDCLPVGRSGELLCSYSTNRNEFWISLIEKAYMKVMGGYDFPGSNSNIDLYALTGWIPERVSIKESDFNKDAVFRKIFDRFYKGDVLVTMATGEMSSSAADRAGLVSTHAYAMLDIKEVKSQKLILLKNPWSHLRWKGNFSELDTRNWTPQMCEALNFNPKSAQNFDNGVFWIDYDSICHFFDVIYMSWNPRLFSHTYCIHQSWNAGVGPAKDLYNIGENPQYSLEVSSMGGAAVWVLLTRHITEIEDFKDNKEFITLLVYKTDGKKVYYPYSPPPYIDGVRINSPHYLCKMVLKEAGLQKFTLVVSQYEKQNTIHYSLRVYSTAEFKLQKLQNLCKYKHEVTGKWSGASAGGCPNYPATYKNNPSYQFRIETDIKALCIQLRAPKEIQIGFDIICVEAKNTESKGYFSKKESGSYRSGFVIIDLQDVVAGVYNITVSTFYPKLEAPYFLTLLSSSPVKLNRLK